MNDFWSKHKKKILYISHAAIFFVGIFLILHEDYLPAVIIFLLPLLFISTIHLSHYPYLCIIGVGISYILKLQFDKFGITSNMLFIVLCAIAILIGQEKFKFIFTRKFFILLLLYISYIIFSFYLSHGRYDMHELQMYVNHVIVMILMFTFDNEIKRELFYKAIVVSALILFAAGIFQIIQIGHMPKGYMTGYFSNHVGYSYHMAIGIPFGIFLFQKHRHKFYLIASLLLTCGLIMAFSRGVLMALISAIFCYYTIKHFSFSKHKKIIYIVGLFILCIGIFFMYYNLISRVQYGSVANKFTSGRALFYQAAWNIIKEKPIVGIGWEKYKDTWMNYVYVPEPQYGTSITRMQVNTHSSYLRILSELGIIGLTMYLLFNMFMLKDTWDVLLSKEGVPIFIILLTYFFHGLVDNNAYGNDRMFYFSVGLLYSIRYYGTMSKQ